MRKDIKHIARRSVAPCTGDAQVMVKSGDVDDIIKVIMHADENSRGATLKFVPYLKGKDDMATLKNVWKFVRQHIEYVRDPDDEEIIKTPGCTLAEGQADCKSMTILTGSLLRDLGYSFAYRVAFYDPRQPQQGHIYAVVKLGGKTVVVDPVYHRFNEEVKPWKYQDYTPSGMAAIGSLPAPVTPSRRSLFILAAVALTFLLHD